MKCSQKSKKREILTLEQSAAVFASEWENDIAKLANAVAQGGNITLSQTDGALTISGTASVSGSDQTTYAPASSGQYYPVDIVGSGNNANLAVVRVPDSGSSITFTPSGGEATEISSIVAGDGISMTLASGALKIKRDDIVNTNATHPTISGTASALSITCPSAWSYMTVSYAGASAGTTITSGNNATINGTFTNGQILLVTAVSTSKIYKPFGIVLSIESNTASIGSYIK